MNRYPILFLAVMLAGAVAAGCSGPSTKVADYEKARTVKPLDVPPDLDRPDESNAMELPQVVPDSERRSGPAKLLPDGNGVSVRGRADRRWLVVDAPAEDVWPELVAFWKGQGFDLRRLEPQIGIMETAWAENRADIPVGSIRNVIGKVFPKLYSADTRDMFRTRLERGDREGTTEVYVTHYGMEERSVDEDGIRTRWQSRRPDPALINEMINRLLVHLGVSEQTARQQIAREDAEPAHAHLVDGPDGASVLRLDDGFARAWRRAGMALDRAGFVVEDRNRSAGTYFVSVVVPAEGEEDPGWLSSFLGSEPTEAQRRLRVVIRGEDGTSTLSVLDENGKKADKKLADPLLTRLEEQLR